MQEGEEASPRLQTAPEKLLIGAGSMLKASLGDTGHGGVETRQLL